MEEHKLDEGIKGLVLLLRANSVETFESCEGGLGHCFAEPTIRFWGDKNEGLRVALICIKEALPIQSIRRAFEVINDELQSPFWEVTFKASYSISGITLDRSSGLFVDYDNRAQC